MYYTYILESLKNGGHYIGHTENLKIRIERHNKGYVRSTKNTRPWKIIHNEEFETKQEAYGRELHLKSYKGGNEFRKLINK
ncbi:GIY-YIG nuclease family protein [Patescibacteria group bacterium]|nr:GIY-YIG nuclease family protein [Patescibacteria group bacterium]